MYSYLSTLRLNSSATSATDHSNLPLELLRNTLLVIAFYKVGPGPNGLDVGPKTEASAKKRTHGGKRPPPPETGRSPFRQVTEGIGSLIPPAYSNNRTSSGASHLGGVVGPSIDRKEVEGTNKGLLSKSGFEEREFGDATAIRLEHELGA